MFKLIAGAVLALAATAPAAAVTYTTGTAQFNSLGDTIGSAYDQITLGGVSGSATGLGTYLVNNVTFTVGLNSNTGGDYTGSFTDTATVGGSPYSYTVPYAIHISSTDSITLGGNSFRTDGVVVTFNKLTFSNIGSTATGNLTATVSVPEPATWAMMIAGFGLVGVGLRRRSANTVAA